VLPEPAERGLVRADVVDLAAGREDPRFVEECVERLIGLIEAR